ncbi:MAG: hypothetical protein EA411_10135 [Saprospirales bacterium]|nr:MAG: hypothetical protein EA411_10135 [Saprospirales bacterium]
MILVQKFFRHFQMKLIRETDILHTEFPKNHYSSQEPWNYRPNPNSSFVINHPRFSNNVVRNRGD